MSDDKSSDLADQVGELAAEIAALRESIVTAAEWDAEARRVRQVALDTTLADVQRWLRVLIGVIVVLVLLIGLVWLRMQGGG